MPPHRRTDPSVTSAAIVAWTGFGREAWPTRDDASIVIAYGADLADAILHEVHYLKDRFYASNAKHVAGDLVEMGRMAAAEFRSAHPEISEQAVESLVWCYTFDNK